MTLRISGATRLVQEYLDNYGFRFDPEIGWHGEFPRREALRKKRLLEELAAKRKIRLTVETK